MKIMTTVYEVWHQHEKNTEYGHRTAAILG